MNIFYFTATLGEAQFSFGEHVDKVLFHLGAILPLALLMLAFTCLGLWLAWILYKEFFDRYENARNENRNLISEFDEVVEEQKVMLQELHSDYAKARGQLGRREESIKELHCKLGEFESDAGELREQLELMNAEVAKVTKKLDDSIGNETKSRELETEVKKNDDELSKLKNTLTVKEGLDVKLSDLEKQLATRTEEFDALKSINQHLKRENNQFKEEIGEAVDFLSESEGDGSSSIKGVFSSMSALSARVPDLEDGLEEKDNQIAELKNQLEEALQEKESKVNIGNDGEKRGEAEPPEGVDADEVDVAEKPEETMQKFEGESVRADQKFGVVYTEKPDKVDDLKRIKGVGKVLEEKLNEFGVYRFKQVALWTPPVVNEFVENLPFGDRVTRDHWIDQAKEFHESKYGEAVIS